jgi:carboxypeptidase C (cathepsin A)
VFLRRSTKARFIIMKYLLLTGLLALAVLAAPEEDRANITIPGYSLPWYSGYLEFDTGKFHYVFFNSQRDPVNDPVVLWLNGGPGCSSLLGMVYETGPFVFKEGTANFDINEFAWNKKANLLFLSSPGGVGFS